MAAQRLAVAGVFFMSTVTAGCTFPTSGDIPAITLVVRNDSAIDMPVFIRGSTSRDLWGVFLARADGADHPAPNELLDDPSSPGRVVVMSPACAIVSDLSLPGGEYRLVIKASGAALLEPLVGTPTGVALQRTGICPDPAP